MDFLNTPWEMNNQLIKDNGIRMNKMPNYRDNYMFNMDTNTMLDLGFYKNELDTLQQAVNLFGIVSSQKLMNPPFMIHDQITISRIMYAYNICMGRVQIDPDNIFSISKHMKKLSRISGLFTNFSCFYIPHREIYKVPRNAVVANIPQGSFYVLNSNLYDKTDSTYEVIQIAQEWVTIKSTRKMGVTYKDRLNKSYENREWGIPGILKVESIGSQSENRPWVLKIHKSHCRLCNRFLIIVTTRRIADGAYKHLGGYSLVLVDGTILYVYAKSTDLDSYGNPKDSVPKSTNDTIVLDYGFYPFEIETKIKNAIDRVSTKYGIAYIKRLVGEEPFKMIPEYSGMEQIKRDNNTENSDSLID